MMIILYNIKFHKFVIFVAIYNYTKIWPQKIIFVGSFLGIICKKYYPDKQANHKPDSSVPSGNRM